MPLYVYDYLDGEGVPRSVEQLHRFPPPETVSISVGDEVFRATRRQVHQIARQATQWQVLGRDSDLPPENAPPIDG